MGGLGVLTACTQGGATPVAKTTAPAAGGTVFEIQHWHTLTASDGEVWQQAIDNFNAANKEQSLHITAQVVPSDQFGIKLLASSTTGEAPDFGWGEGFGRRDWVNKGVLVQLDDLVKKAGLDMTDLTDQGLHGATYDNKLYGVPMDALSFQMLVNADHVKDAGLDPARAPATGAEVLDWADKMTQRAGDTVNRSGFLMTGSGLHINLVWSVIAHQMGFRQFSDDLKTAMVNPDAGKQAAQWVLDLFDQRKVSTRDVTDRYKAFGTGQGSIFWTGAWTLSGYVAQNLNFYSAIVPAVGKDHATRGELWNIEMYTQRDQNRYDNTIRAMKWLSDNVFFWSTKGRGPTSRKSVLNRADFKTAVYDQRVRGAFLDGAANATFLRAPVVATDDFQPYTATGLIARAMDPVWARQTSIDVGLAILGDQWQKDLDAG
jgi:ABC-type glycerol-3-phosphate transport system substrate-binding protein